MLGPLDDKPEYTKYRIQMGCSAVDAADPRGGPGPGGEWSDVLIYTIDIPYGFWDNPLSPTTKDALETWVTGGGMALGLLLGIVSTGPVGGVLAAVGVVLIGVWFIARDPPDENFEVLADHQPLVLPTVAASEEIPAALADSLNEWGAALSRARALSRALLLSLERAFGATLAGEEVWVDRQLNAARGHADGLAGALEQEIVIRTRLVETARAHPIPATPVPDNLEEILTGLADGSAESIGVLSAIGATEREIEAFRFHVLNGADTYRELRDSGADTAALFLAALDNPEATEESAQAASELRTFASGGSAQD